MSFTARIAAALLVLQLGSLTATSAFEPSSVSVTVTDPDGKHVAEAQIFDAAQPAKPLAESGSDGTARLAVALGVKLYAVRGTARSQTATVAGDSLQLVLSYSTIVRVAAPRTSLEDRIYTANSAAAVVSGSPFDALGLVPNYRGASQGGVADMELNGTPLQLPPDSGGGSNAGRALLGQLVESFSTAQADTGSLEPNLHLLMPAAQPRYGLTFGSGAFDAAQWKATAQGRTPALGYAFTLAGRSDEGLLASQTFRDASGLRYDHSDSWHGLGGTADLDFNLRSWHVQLVGIGDRASGADMPALDPGGGIPIGYGPGGTSGTTFGDGYVLATTTHGRDSLSVLDVRYNGSGNDDLAGAVFLGTPVGASDGYRYSGRYDELGLTRAFGTRSLTLKASDGETATTAFGDGFTSGSSSGERRASLTYEERHRTVTANATLGVLSDDGDYQDRALFANAGAQGSSGAWRWSAAAFYAPAQALEAQRAPSVLLASPALASFDCPGASAVLQAPSELDPRHPRSLTLKATLERDMGRLGQFGLGGFLANTQDALVQSTERAVAGLPAGYAAQLTSYFDTLCAAGGAPSIYQTRYRSVPSMRAQEWYVDDLLPLGSFALRASYETFSIETPYAPSAFASTIVPDAQLPGIPLHRANLLLSRQFGRSLGALDVAYLSRNDAENLPSRIVLSLGASLALGAGHLDFSAQNALGAYDGRFTSPAYAQAVPLSDGSSLQTLAQPLPQRWSLRYTVAFPNR